jgi:hypothetical protein
VATLLSGMCHIVHNWYLNVSIGLADKLCGLRNCLSLTMPSQDNMVNMDMPDESIDSEDRAILIVQRQLVHVQPSVFFVKLSEIPIDPVTDTSQVTSGIRGSGISRGPFLQNAEEVTRGRLQRAGEQASAGQEGHVRMADAKTGGTRTVHLAMCNFTGAKEIDYCGKVVNKEQI